MSSKTTIPSLWPKEESSDTILSTSTYISVDEYMRPPDGQPQIERFVRLMSLDNNESCQSPSNVEYEDLTGTCSQYWDIISFSENFVDDIIYEAEGIKLQ